MDGFAPMDQHDGWAAHRPLPNILKRYGAVSRGNSPPAGNGTRGGRPRGLVKNESMFHLAGLVDDRGGTYEHCRKSKEELKAIKNKKVREFYIAQNELLDFFKEIDEVLDSATEQLRNQSRERNERRMTLGSDDEDESETDHLLPMPVTSKGRAEEEEAENRDVRWTINVNLVINVLLLAGKALVALLSNSISLIASLLDSFMDLMSTLIIGWTNRQMDTKDRWGYPVGKRRMEPMGVVIFSVLMVSAFVQTAVESLQRLFSPDLAPAYVPLPAIIVMVGTIVVKGVVWLWCRRKTNSSVKALAQDAENDCVFNFFSLLFPFIGARAGIKWLDALGGLLLSIYIIYEWMDTLIDNTRNLTGRRGSPKQHNRVVYLCTRFAPLIKGVQHCTVYRAGDGHIVEVDVIVPPKTPLPVAHGLGESVQYSLECLRGFDRVYVHVDIVSNPLSGHLER